ncbi:MAG: choice-of-anchor J domain-containing protein, partial [Candidatus Cloacimonetes bacterium]|nr:choice-of-anchor J domain-containing protein [Candidatus Cloacimonadota bacterium]MCK9185558.1 choice-of-anchor J domain-containing protein [Candidatus Cloacimonadota bacterium]
MKTRIITILLLLCTSLLLAQWHIDEGFEDSANLPTGWSTHDDGDGSIWRVSTSNAHSGTRAAFVDNYLPNQNQDWLITPQITVNAGDYLEFYTRAWYGTEGLKVYVSTSGTQVSNFTTLLLNMPNLTATYQMGTVSLDSYAGQNIYLGFYWECDTYGILVDDVKVGQVPTVDPELNLPETASFYQSEELQMDFSPYIVVTDPASASLSVSGNTNIAVEINGLEVIFSAPDFAGTEELTFTLLDTQSSQTASDMIFVSALADPTADLYVSEVIYPRYHEFVGLPFTPQIRVGNAGTTTWNGSIEIVLNVSNYVEESQHIDTAIIDAEILPDGSVSVSFPQSFTPEQIGPLNYSFHILTQDDNPDNNSFTFVSEAVIRESTGGPDGFGYRYIDSNEPLGPQYDWIEISETGTSTIMYEVDAFHGDDNFSEPIPLAFDFPFYGSTYSSAYVDINGEILLADNTWYTNFPGSGWGGDGNMFNYMYPIPGYTQMPGLIAVYWDDLEADEGTGDVYYQSFGTAPERYMVFQWDSLRFRSGTGAQQLLKFQLIMHENGDLKMQYHTVATEQTGASIPHDHGRSSTIAIQNEAADTGLCYLREIVQGSSYIGVEPAGNLLHDNLAILFYGGEDNQAPIITHEAAGNTFSQDIELTAHIIDMSELTDLTMHYDIGAGWQSTQYSSLEQNDYSFAASDLP